MIHEILKEIVKAHALKTSYAEVRSLQHLALHHLAELNGWTTGPKVRAFRLRDIGRRSGNWPDYHEVLDHCCYFRGFGRCAAILAEPYEHSVAGVPMLDTARALAERFGLACHVAPVPKAGIWYPGYSLAICFTAPGHVMAWLPEQLTGFNQREEHSNAGPAHT